MEKEQLLKELNHFTRREFKEEEVYLFDLILCDSEVDRDGDCFSKEALEELRERFVGVTGIFDHDPKSGNQTARIFKTEIITDETRQTLTGQPYRALKACAYMPRTRANEDLITEIDAGIKREVSVSFSCGRRVCSVCGTNRLKKSCPHIPGRVYEGKTCYMTLDGVTDVYEWSFVAIPAQRRAGVVKTMGGAQSPENAEITRLQEELARAREAFAPMLTRDIAKLCEKDRCGEIFTRLCKDMDLFELMDLREQLLKTDPQTQPAQLCHRGENVADFKTSKEETEHGGLCHR